MTAACGSDIGPTDNPGGDAGVDPTGDGGGVGPDATDWNATFEEVLPDDHVVEIELDFAPGDYEAMLQEWDNSQVKNYHMADFSHDGEALANIGVRLKGYSSLLFGSGGPGGPLDPNSNLPLKLNFNKFGSERFHKVDRLNLGNNVFDPSYMRERLGSRMFAAMGVPVARTAYANVSVDERYLGVYSVVQQVDKTFLKQHFGTANGADNGNLYKCVPNEIGTCTLQWRGADPASYHHSHSCNIGYEECGLVLKTNQDDPLPACRRQRGHVELRQLLRTGQQLLSLSPSRHGQIHDDSLGPEHELRPLRLPRGLFPDEHGQLPDR
jgi:hypothetical protein